MSRVSISPAAVVGAGVHVETAQIEQVPRPDQIAADHILLGVGVEGADAAQVLRLVGMGAPTVEDLAEGRAPHDGDIRLALDEAVQVVHRARGGVHHHHEVVDALSPPGGQHLAHGKERAAHGTGGEMQGIGSVGGGEERSGRGEKKQKRPRSGQRTCGIQRRSRRIGRRRSGRFFIRHSFIRLDPLQAPVIFHYRPGRGAAQAKGCPAETRMGQMAQRTLSRARSQ